MDRLAVDAPEVAARLSRASESERINLVHLACQQAMAASGLKDPSATQALATVELGTPNPTLSAALSDLAESLDTQYFDAHRAALPA